MVALQIIVWKASGGRRQLFGTAPLHRWLEKRGFDPVNIFYIFGVLAMLEPFFPLVVIFQLRKFRLLRFLFFHDFQITQHPGQGPDQQLFLSDHVIRKRIRLIDCQHLLQKALFLFQHPPEQIPITGSWFLRIRLPGLRGY